MVPVRQGNLLQEQAPGVGFAWLMMTCCHAMSPFCAAKICLLLMGQCMVQHCCSIPRLPCTLLQQCHVGVLQVIWDL